MASATTKLKLAKHKKTDKLYNKDTMLVFNSADKDRLVIGRIEDDEFVSLDQDSVELCEKHGFKYDESLVEVEEAEEEEKPAKAPSKAREKPVKKSEEEEEKPAKKSEEEEEEKPAKAPSHAPAKRAEAREKPVKKSEEEEEEKPAPSKKSEAVVNAKKPADGFDTMVNLANELHELLLMAKDNYGNFSARVADLEKEVETLKAEIVKKDKKIKAFLAE